MKRVGAVILAVVVALVSVIGRSFVRLRDSERKMAEVSPERLRIFGHLSPEEAATVSSLHHRPCFDAATKWKWLRVTFEQPQYFECLDKFIAERWRSRARLSNSPLEQDPYFPEMWRTFVAIEGERPEGTALKYTVDCDHLALTAVLSNVGHRDFVALSATSGRWEIGVPKRLAELCPGKPLLATALIGEWPLSEPLAIVLLSGGG